MKNILISVITLLVIILTVLMMVKGITIGNFSILSISQIIDQSKQLNTKIDNLNQLNNITYKKTLADLNESTKIMQEAKSKYLELASTSSNDEIKGANQEEAYSREFLWSKIGNHATANGINLKMDVTSTGLSNKNILNFTAKGSYIGIRNFIYSLENDKILNFTIENFKILEDKTESNKNANLICTFLVSDVAIKQEQVTTEVKTTKTTTTNNNATNTVNTNSASQTTSNTAESQIGNAVSQ